MSFFTSSSRCFLAAFVVGAAATLAVITRLDERPLHTGREYAMSRATRDRIEAACEAGHIGLAVFGGSRTVAAIDDEALEAAGYDVWKIASGGAGPIFAAYGLQRLHDCGVTIDAAVLSYGPVHIFAPGAILKMGVNYDYFKGDAARETFEALGRFEDSRARRLVYRGVAVLGTEVTLLDFILLRPALKTALLEPTRAVANTRRYEETYAAFFENGTTYYGRAERIDEPPADLELDMTRIPTGVTGAIDMFVALAKEMDAPVYFHYQPMNEVGYAQLPPHAFDTLRAFDERLEAQGVTVLNAFSSLPPEDFGDISHVNHRGRPVVTEELIEGLARAGVQPVLSARR